VWYKRPDLSDNHLISKLCEDGDDAFALVGFVRSAFVGCSALLFRKRWLITEFPVFNRHVDVVADTKAQSVIARFYSAVDDIVPTLTVACVHFTYGNTEKPRFKVSQMYGPEVRAQQVTHLLDKRLLKAGETATTTIVAGDTNFRPIDVTKWWPKEKKQVPVADEMASYLLREDGGVRETLDIEHCRLIGVDAPFTYDKEVNNPQQQGGGRRRRYEGMSPMQRYDRVYVRGLADDDNDFTTRVETMQRPPQAFWSDHFAVVSNVVYASGRRGDSGGGGGGGGGGCGGSGGVGDVGGSRGGGGGNRSGGKQKRDDVFDLTGD
jgi:uncharacterized membrane protein YgcG